MIYTKQIRISSRFVPIIFYVKKILQEFQKQSGEKQNTVKEYEDIRTDLEQELYDSIFHT
jgi:hypothetical protein